MAQEPDPPRDSGRDSGRERGAIAHLRALVAAIVGLASAYFLTTVLLDLYGVVPYHEPLTRALYRIFAGGDDPTIGLVGAGLAITIPIVGILTFGVGAVVDRIAGARNRTRLIATAGVGFVVAALALLVVTHLIVVHLDLFRVGIVGLLLGIPLVLWLRYDVDEDAVSAMLGAVLVALLVILIGTVFVGPEAGWTVVAEPIDETDGVAIVLEGDDIPPAVVEMLSSSECQTRFDEGKDCWEPQSGSDGRQLTRSLAAHGANCHAEIADVSVGGGTVGVSHKGDLYGLQCVRTP